MLSATSGPVAGSGAPAHPSYVAKAGSGNTGQTLSRSVRRHSSSLQAESSGSTTGAGRRLSQLRVSVSEGVGDDYVPEDGTSSVAGRGSNPFRIPTEEEVFIMRDKERHKKKELREQFQRMSILEKTQVKVQSATVRIREVQQDDQVELTEEDLRQTEAVRRSLEPLLSRKSSDTLSSKQKENLTEYIGKKREMFLVQMSLDAKKEEIRKLEEKAAERERKLQEDEEVLEENAQKFDEFLKDNDMKAVEAMRKAEAQTKEKLDKVAEIKRLNAQIQAIKAQMSSDEEKLEEWRKYKDFLMSLTPEEWKNAQRERVRKEKFEKMLAEQEQAGASFSSGAQGSVADDDDASSKNGGGPSSAGAFGQGASAIAAAASKALKRVKAGVTMSGAAGAGNNNTSSASLVGPAPSGPLSAAGGSVAIASDGKATKAPEAGRKSRTANRAVRIEDVQVEDSELPIYFRDPQQLLDIFTSLEESNLFLIQNSQETEEALEEVKQKFEQLRVKLEGETQVLLGQVTSLKELIAVESSKANAYKNRTMANSSGNFADRSLADLNSKVLEVYQQAGFENDAKLSALDMLRCIESKMDELINETEQMSPEVVEHLEKSREKERRHKIREEKLEEQRRQQEERIKRALERSQAPIKKRTGKPEMFRSYLPQKTDDGSGSVVSPGKPSKKGGKNASDLDHGMDRPPGVEDFFC